MKYFNLLLLFTLSVNAQITFEKGYFIDNDNNKTDCLIKNADWSNSPDGFTYKLSESSNSKKILIGSVLEFRIYDTDQYYMRHKLSKSLSNDNNVIIKRVNDFIFLKVLLNGEASLFEYQNGKDFFFYNLSDNSPKYLPYKKYLDDNNKLKETNEFRKALYEDLKCDDFSINTFTELKYVSDKLVDLFETYNQCVGQDFEEVYSNRTKAIFRFKLNGGIHFNSKLSDEYAYNYGYDNPPSAGGGRTEASSKRDISLGGKSNFSIGFETELVLPFDRNKWSIFVAPNYQSIAKVRGNEDFLHDGFINFSYSSELSYSFIEIPVGLRYYFNLNDKMQLFTQVAYTHNVIVDSEQVRELEASSTNVQSLDSELRGSNGGKEKNFGGFLGFGINYDNKFAFAINYSFAKNVKIKEGSQTNLDGAISFIASYTIF